MRPDFTDASIGFLISQTSRKTINLLMQRLREYDITPEQWSVLYQLHKEGPITQKEIAKLTAKDQPTTARIADLLIKKELIHKKMSPEDRRAFIVSLTNKGEAVAAKIVPIESQTMDDILSGINQNQVQQFKEMLQKINDNIDNLNKS